MPGSISLGRVILVTVDSNALGALNIPTGGFDSPPFAVSICPKTQIVLLDAISISVLRPPPKSEESEVPSLLVSSVI